MYSRSLSATCFYGRFSAKLHPNFHQRTHPRTASEIWAQLDKKNLLVKSSAKDSEST